MTEYTRDRHDPTAAVPPQRRRRRTNPAVFIIGVVFVLAAALGLVYGLGRPLPSAAIRFGLPVALIALGLLGLLISRPPASSRSARRHRPPRSPRE